LKNFGLASKENGKYTTGNRQQTTGCCCALMPTKSRWKYSQQVIATNMSLDLPSHQHLKNLRQTNKKTDWSVIRKLGRATDVRDRQHHRSLPLPRKFGAHKNMVKDMDKTTGKSNFMNDINTSGIRPDRHNTIHYIKPKPPYFLSTKPSAYLRF
jgi:hypothetical protein